MFEIITQNLFISIVILLLILLIFAFKKEKNKFTTYYLLMNLLTFIYISLNILLIQKILYNFEIIIESFQIFFVITIFTLWFIIIAILTNQMDKYKNKILLIYLIPGITFLFSLTNSWTSLLYYYNNGELTYGIVSYAMVFIALILFIGSVLLGVNAYKKNKKEYKNMMIILFALPIIFYIIELISLNLFKTLGYNAIFYTRNTLGIFFMCLISFYVIYYTNIGNKKIYSRYEFIKEIKIGIVRIDNNYKIFDYNIYFEEIFKNKNLNKIRDFSIILDEINLDIVELKNIFKTQKFYNFYYSKTDKWYQLCENNIYDTENNKIIGKIFTFYDITNIKNKQYEQIQLEAKTIKNSYLLKEQYNNTIKNIQEIHIRLKIQYDILITFTDLEKRYNKTNKEINDILKNYLNITQINYNVYNIPGTIIDSNLINLTKYIKNLIKIYDMNGINIFYDMDETIIIPIENFIFTSVIINELIENVIKHGFTDSFENKKLDIILKRSTPNTAYLIIKNNNNKIPEDINMYDYSTVGFGLIYELTQQLDGKLTQIDDENTGIKIEFPIENS